MTTIVLRKSLAIVFILVALTADISKADVSMTQHGKQVGPSSGEWTRTLRIKGLKMRIDTARNGDNFITIYDLSSGKGYQLYPKRKEAIVVDLKSASGPPNGLSPDKLRHNLKEAGKKREIGGMSCDEYSFDLQGPYTAPGNGVAFVQNDSGTFCVSRTIPEGIEVTNFVQEAIKRGYRLAISALSPTQTSVGSYFWGQEPNMLVVAAIIESRINGPGMKSGTIANITNNFVITDIKSGSIPDEEFQIPVDWKQKKESNFR
jgi:hypothetical protein